MSSLEAPAGTLPTFKKAVISLWFRVPQSSIDACVAAYAAANAASAGGDLSGVNALFSGVIPLLTFGVTGKRPTYVIDNTDLIIGHYVLSSMQWTGDGPWILTPVSDDMPVNPSEQVIQSGPLPRSTEDIITNPSYIGVSCWDVLNGLPPALSISFETGAYPDTLTGFCSTASDDGSTWYLFNPTIATSPAQNAAANVAAAAFPPWVQTIGSIDTSRITSNTTAQYSSASIAVTPDEWHHVLVSIDLSAPTQVHGVNSMTQAAGVRSAPKMWLALDDVNYTGKALSNGSPTGGDPNAVLPGLACTMTTLYPSESSSTVIFTGLTEYEYEVSAPIPAGVAAVGLPATGQYARNILPVDLAELQIFTGVSMDTGVETNRRAFINSKGYPVDPNYGQAKIKKTPNVTPSEPVKLLGKAPDISFTRSAINWTTGYNLGSAKAKIIKTGKITPVSPDPKIVR